MSATAGSPAPSLSDGAAVAPAPSCSAQADDNPAPLTYAASGVDISAGEEAVARLAPLAEATYRPEVLGGVGAFASAVALPSGYDDPVLVTANDGAGTKPLVAAAAQRYDTVGIDLVAMCVDDVATTGAEPLLFQDQITMGRVDPTVVEQLVAGIATGCQQAGCSLTGGEVAEHPDAMRPGEFDICGFAVGVAERNQLAAKLGAESVGATLVGLASGGIRCNGISLARRALLGSSASLRDAAAASRLNEPAWPGADVSIADVLLEPSVVLAPLVCQLFREAGALAAAHITGGGIAGNLARICGAGVLAAVNRHAWPRPRVFAAIADAGNVAPAEMEAVFNLGVAMVVAVPPDAAEAAISLAQTAGVDAWSIGHVVDGSATVGDAMGKATRGAAALFDPADVPPPATFNAGAHQ